MKTICLGAIAVLVPGLSLRAQTIPSAVSVQAWTGASTYQVGSKIDLHIRMTLSPDGVVEVKPAVGQLEPFEPLNLDVAEPVEENGLFSQRWVLQLITFNSGRLTIPPVRFRVRNGDSNESVQTPAVDVSITTPPVDVAGELRPPRPPLPIPWTPDWLRTAALTLAVAGMVSMSYLTSRLRFKLKIHWRSADQRIEARLRRLERRLPATDDDIADFYAAVSKLVRTCAQSTSGVPVGTLSTTELVGALARSDAATSVLGDLERLLRTADLVKFARWRPTDVAIHRAAVRQARELIHAMRVRS